MSFRRRRVPVACALCRRRKRRCDAQKPVCGSCQELEAECLYETLPLESVQPQDELDVAESLHRIETLLRENQAVIHTALHASGTSPTGFPGGNSVSTSIQEAATLGLSPNTPVSNANHYAEHMSYPSNEAHDTSTRGQASLPLTIPDKHSTSSNSLLSSEAMRDMLGHYPDDYFYRLETRACLPLELSFTAFRESGATPHVDLSRETTDHLLRAFRASVHCQCPLLNTERLHSVYRLARESSYTPSPESNLCYIVFALGCVADRAVSPTETTLPGICYIQLAMPSLLLSAAWEHNQDITTVQCSLLANVYFASIAKPLHSWKLVSMAATMIQLRLSKVGSDRNDPTSREQLIRTYWNCFMVECDRLAELEVPQSGLQNIVDTMPLPSFCGGFDDAETTYYLAEISIRRLLNRVHNSIYLRSPAVDNYTTIPRSAEQLTRLLTICQELHRQLDAWIASIPEPCRPHLVSDNPPRHNREQILRIRYLATLHIIYRPFVLHVIASERHHVPVGFDDGATRAITLEKCHICINACTRYIYHAGEMLGRLSPYIWTFSISSFGAVLVLTMASQSSLLQPWVLEIEDLQELVIRNIERSAAQVRHNCQPDHSQTETSLEAAVEILKEVKRKGRMRRLVH